MIGNILVALTGLAFMAPMNYASVNNDKVTVWSIFPVLVFTFFSHLVENHKLGSIGIPSVPHNVSIVLNWLDRLGVLIVASRFMYIGLINWGKWQLCTDDVLLTLVTLMLGFLSEQRVDRIWYHHIPLHSMWHIMVSRNMMVFLSKMYQP